jgi:hypothetical protein
VRTMILTPLSIGRILGHVEDGSFYRNICWLIRIRTYHTQSQSQQHILVAHGLGCATLCLPSHLLNSSSVIGVSFGSASSILTFGSNRLFSE